MALKLDNIWHRVLELYQDYSKRDLGLAFISFNGKVKYGKMLEHKISESFEAFYPRMFK